MNEASRNAEKVDVWDYDPAAVEIVPGLWLGSDRPIPGFKGMSLCVLEYPHKCHTKEIHIPILSKWGLLKTEMEEAEEEWEGGPTKASMEALNLAADTIESTLMLGVNIRVHCAAGIERSPLTVVWYLHTRKSMCILEAYLLVMYKRACVADRSEWLPRRETWCEKHHTYHHGLGLA